MGRRPKPYIKGNYYCTKVGGRQHQKLCHISEGLKAAENALARLLVLRDEQERLSKNPAAAPTMGLYGGFPADPLHEAQQAPLVCMAIDEFLTFQKNNNRDGHYKWICKHLELFREQFGERRIDSISHVDADNFKHWLINERVNQKSKKKGNFKPATVNHELRACKSFFRWATSVSRRYRYRLLVSPFQETKFCEDEARERLVTEAEFNAFLDNVGDGGCLGGKRDMRDTLKCLRYTTMRPGELCALRWEHIDYKNFRIVIPGKLIKTKKRREITMLDELVEVLQLRRSWFNEMGKPKEGFVFTKAGNRDGKRVASGSEDPMTVTTLGRKFLRIKERCIELGLLEKHVKGQEIVLYSFRHSRITEMFLQGIDSHYVQFEAGHSSPVTTERYKHLKGAHVAPKVREKWEIAKGSEDSEEA